MSRIATSTSLRTNSVESVRVRGCGPDTGEAATDAGGAIQVEPESQEFRLGADLLVLDNDGPWIHADCF